MTDSTPPSPHADDSSESVRGEATLALRELRDGAPGAADRLLPLVYEELRSLAENQMRRERPGHTLQPTVLVHDAFMRLVAAGSSAPQPGSIDWENRSHFYGLAAKVIRQILVDHARARAAQKRGGEQARVSLVDSAIGTGESELDVIELDDLLQRLAELDERQARVVELRFFAGLSVEEAAHALGVSARTVKGDWQVAKAWLKRELEREDEEG